MDLSRRGFLAGAGALAASIAAAPKVVFAERVRRRVVLPDHTDWKLVRPHVLGHLSLDEMATGLPGPFQEYMASWDVNGADLLVPVSIPGVLEDGNSLAKLPSGFEVTWNCWMPLYDKWNKQVFQPVYGYEFKTANLGAAVLTNINLFRMAMKYKSKSWNRPGA